MRSAVVLGVSSAVVLAAASAVAGAVAGVPIGAAVGITLGTIAGVTYGRAVQGVGAYDIGSWRGRLAFVLDHTWSLPNTFVGALFLAGNLLAGNRIDVPASRGHNCVHLVGGVIPGYLTTIGTVIAGIAPAAHPHEHGHIAQARALGPLYIPSVLVHYVVVTLVPYWLVRHDHERFPLRGVRGYFVDGVYLHVWHEAWCYRRHGPQRRPRDVRGSEKLMASGDGAGRGT
ncbi:MAG TPA: hypothetical protein VI076_15540 [Actinopolymorphaceae bacterium]